MLSRELDLPYNTAGFLLHRIREPSKGSKRGRGTSKTKLIVAVSKTPDGKPLYLKMQVVPNLKDKTIGNFAKANICERSMIQTDACYSLPQAVVREIQREYEMFSPDSERLHIMTGNAKAFVGDTFHGLGGKHLGRHLAEFSYRFNRRYLPYIFSNLCNAVMISEPLTFAELSR